MPSITPLNKALILINVLVFGLQYMLGGLIDAYFALWPPQAEQYGAPPFQVWQLLSGEDGYRRRRASTASS